MRHAKPQPQNRARTMLRVGAPFVGIMMFIGVVGGSYSEDVGVDDAREWWAIKGPTTYEITYTYRGLGPATVVFDGVAVIEYRTGDPRLEDATIYWVRTLFDAVDQVEDDLRGDVLAVEFDAEWGYPISASLDPDRDETGDEWSFEVLSLVAVEIPE